MKNFFKYSIRSVISPSTAALRLQITVLPAIAAIIFCAVSVTACASVQTDILYSGEAVHMHEKTLDDLETGIVLQRAQRNSAQLEQIRTNIEGLLKEPSTDSAYFARLYALYADVYLLQGQSSAAREQLTKAKRYNEYDEYVQLITARLIPEPEKRKSYLEDRTTQTPEYYRLKAELGGFYFDVKDYRNALAAFDSSLAFLPDAYRQLYGKQREQSFQLYTVGDVRESSEKILRTSPISLLEMTVLTQDSTHALDFITGTAEWKPPLLAEHLQKNGWYNPEKNVRKDSASKKDAALFLWHLIVGDNEKRLTKYTRYYTNKRRLPMPDVKLDGIYFDAIVGTVEEDVIPLADGKHFEPDNPVSGMEFYRWLLKADALR